VPANVALRCGSASTGGTPPVLCSAQAAGPVRVALLVSLRSSVAIAAAEEALTAGLGREPWIQLLDRNHAAGLLSETDLAPFADPAGATGLAETGSGIQAADALVICTESAAAQGNQIDITLAYVGQKRRRSLDSLPIDAPQWETLSPTLVAALKEQFQDWDQRGSGDSPAGKGDSPLTVAVLAVDPLIAECDESLPGGLLEALLGMVLTETGAWNVVDRERLNTLLEEQGLSSSMSNAAALTLGRLLSADALLTGNYRLREGRMKLTVRLIDAATGQQLVSADATGGKDDLEALVRQTTSSLQAVRPARSATAEASGAQRALEAVAETPRKGTLEAAQA